MRLNPASDKDHGVILISKYITLGDLELLKGGGGYSSNNSSSRSAPTTPLQHLGTAATNFAVRKGAQKLQSSGKGMMAASFVHTGKSDKIWTSYRKSEHREIRKRTPNSPMAQQKVDSRKYLYRPEGYRGEKLRRRHDGRFLSQEDIHWKRQPRKGKFAKPDPYKVAKTQSRMRFLGMTMYGVGKAVPALGYATLGYGLFKGDALAYREQAKHQFFGLPRTKEGWQYFREDYTPTKEMIGLDSAFNYAKPWMSILS